MFYENSRTLSLYVELDSVKNLKQFMADIKEMGLVISEAHLDKSALSIEGASALTLTVRLPRKKLVNEVLSLINEMPCVILVEEV